MDSFLAYQNPITTDKKLDSEKITIGANDVERERVQIAGKGATEITEVKATNPGTTDNGMVVRNIPYSFTSIADDRKTVTTAGTREKIKTDSTPCKMVVITALATNTDNVVVGGSGVVASSGGQIGIPLMATQSVTIYIDDLNKLYLDAVVSGEGITFTYFN